MDRGQINNDDICLLFYLLFIRTFSFPEAKFLGPFWGDVDSGIWLLYRPARLHLFTILLVIYSHFFVSRGQILRPLLGDIVDSDIGLSYRPARLHIGWRAGTTALCQSRLYPPVRDYEFGYSLSVYSFVVSLLKG